MDKVFADLMGKIMKFYADDMVIKSTIATDDPTHL